jgi:hypothetical protein
MRQRDCRFFVKAENKPAALAAIKALAGKETIHDGVNQQNHHFSWVTTSKFLEADSLEEAMGAWRWTAYEDPNGNIDSIAFEGEKAGDDTVLFEAIAPFVEHGSYIMMEGEDGYIWRWMFTDGAVEEEEGPITFPHDA